MQTAVLAGQQAGKWVLNGQLTAGEIVNELRNGLITVNAEAQRSLSKGGAKGQSTKELIDSERVHVTPRMKDIVKFFNRVMDNVEKRHDITEGFFGAVQFAVPDQFSGARLRMLKARKEAEENYSLGKFLDALGTVKAGTLEINSGLGEPAIHIADGQGRCVGFLSLERTIMDAIDKVKKDIRKLEKTHKSADNQKEELDRLETLLKRIRTFLSTTSVPFILYVADIKDDGTITGIPVEAERRLYIEGNALNSRAAQEEMLKFEYYSPVILLLQEMRLDPGYEWMNQENIEEESKSIGSTSSKIFTLSTLVQAFSRSMVNHTQPIKKAEEDQEVADERSAFTREYWSWISQLFGEYWLPPHHDSVSDRVTYLKERREEQNVAFTAIFLQALGMLGHRLGKEAVWKPESSLLKRLSLLHPRTMNYIARDGSDPDGYNPIWKNAMMKPARDGKWVFNNVTDSVIKTYRALCDQVGIDPAGEAEDTEEMDLELAEAD